MNRKSLSILKLSVRESPINSELTKKRVSFSKIKKVRHIENNKNDFIVDFGSEEEFSLTSEESFKCLYKNKSNVDKHNNSNDITTNLNKSLMDNDKKSGVRRKFSILNFTSDETQLPPFQVDNDANDNSFQLSNRVEEDEEENYSPQRKSIRLDESFPETTLNQSLHASDNEQDRNIDRIDFDLNETLHIFDNDIEEIPDDHDSILDRRISSEIDYDWHPINRENLSFEKILNESYREEGVKSSIVENIDAISAEGSNKTVSKLSTSYKDNNEFICDDLNKVSLQLTKDTSPGCNDADQNCLLDLSSIIVDSCSIGKSVSNFSLDINIDDRVFESSSRYAIDGGSLIENDPPGASSSYKPIDNALQELTNDNQLRQSDDCNAVFNEISLIANCTQNIHNPIVSTNDTFHELENMDPNKIPRQDYRLVNQISPIGKCTPGFNFHVSPDSSFSVSERSDCSRESEQDLNVVIDERNKIDNNSAYIDSVDLLDCSVSEGKDFIKKAEIISEKSVHTPIKMDQSNTISNILILTPNTSHNDSFSINKCSMNDKIDFPDQSTIKNPFERLNLSQCKSNLTIENISKSNSLKEINNQTDIDFQIDSDWNVSGSENIGKSVENRCTVDNKLLTNENESNSNNRLNSCDSNFINFFDKSNSSLHSNTSPIRDSKSISSINRSGISSSTKFDNSPHIFDGANTIISTDNREINFLMKNNAENSQRTNDKEICKISQLPNENIKNSLLNILDESIEENVCLTLDCKEQESNSENRIKLTAQFQNGTGNSFGFINISDSINCDSSFNDDSLVTNNDDILNKAIILNCSSDISMGSLCQDQIMHNTTPNESFSDRSVNIDRIHSNLSSNRDKNKSDINQYNCASNQSIGADDPNIDQLKINSTINEFSIFKNRFLASEYSKESYYDKFSIFEGIDGNLCYTKEEDKFDINQYSHASQQSIGAEDSNISQSEIGGTLIQSFPAIQGIPEQLESRQFTGDISTQHLTDRKSTNWSLFNIEAHSKKYITNPDDSIQFDEMNSVERIRNNKSGSITDFTFDLNNSVRKTFPSTSFDQVPNRNTFRTPINALNIDRNYTSCFASGRKQNEHINQMTPITAVYQIQSNKKQNTIIGSQSKYYNLKLLISSIKSQEKKLDIDLLYDEFFSIDNIHRFNHDLLTVSKKDRDSIISDLKPHPQLCSYPEINQLYLKHIGNPILKVMEFSKTQVQTLYKKFLEKLEKINKLKMKLLITCFFCKRQQLCKHQNELKILTQQIVEDMKINYNFCLREVSMSYNYSLKSGMESFKLEVAKLNIGMRNIIAERQSNKQRIENDRKLALIESRLKQADLLVSSALKMTEMDRVKQALMEKTYSKTPERKKEDYLRFIIDRKTSPFRATHLTNSSMKFSLMGSRVNIIATVRDNGGPQEICIESATVTAEPTLAPMHLCIEAYFQTLVNQYLINRTTDYAKNFLLHHQQPILLLFADVNMCQKYKYLAIYFEPGDSFMLKAQIMSNSPLARFAVLIDLNPISTYHHRLLNYQLEIDYNNVDDSKIRQIIDTTGHGLNKLYRLFDKLFNELSSIVLTL